jgi:hypothetical protein
VVGDVGDVATGQGEAQPDEEPDDGERGTDEPDGAGVDRTQAVSLLRACQPRRFGARVLLCFANRLEAPSGSYERRPLWGSRP